MIVYNICIFCFICILLVGLDCVFLVSFVVDDRGVKIVLGFVCRLLVLL